MVGKFTAALEINAEDLLCCDSQVY